MFTDVAGIGLALLAVWFAGRSANGGRTFGYLRLEILAAVVNAVLLFGVAAFILLEAGGASLNRPRSATGLMLVIALLGFATNAVSLVLLREAQRGSLNVRGAYLEVAGDLAGSTAVDRRRRRDRRYRVDAGRCNRPLRSSGCSSFPEAWRLLREAIDVLLEATPKGMDLAEVRSHIVRAGGVADVQRLTRLDDHVRIERSSRLTSSSGGRRPACRTRRIVPLPARATSTSSTRRSSSSAADRRRLEEVRTHDAAAPTDDRLPRIAR